MSDNIPFEIQMEIIKRVSNVKSLIQFRSVSKPWKSFIDSSDFIKCYGARHTQPPSFLLSYQVECSPEAKYICLIDDDNNETFKVIQQEFAPFVLSPLLKQYRFSYIVGACHGLLCLFCYNNDNYKKMVLIWNPSIGKSFGIAVPDTSKRTHYGFGVCPVTKDPTVVKLVCAVNMPWHVEVFTLSSRVWNVIPSANLPRQTIRLNLEAQVVIDRFIYWGACELTFANDGKPTVNHMLVSFDLITKEFKVVDLPDSLTNELYLSVSKLRESLIVYRSINVEGAKGCDVRLMEHDLSCTKLFTIGARVSKTLGFRKNGEPIFEIQKADGQFTTLHVYDPSTQKIKNLGISRVDGSFFMGSYKESLLLLDHSDLHIYSNND